MQFLHPIYFSLSIMIAAFILFYFFRKQYTEQQISSNFLWQQVLNEWQASPWLQKLQHNLLFWLQLFALLLLMLALVKPFFPYQTVKGEHLILVVDTSASMSAAVDGENRFQLAKAAMQELAAKMNGQEITVIKAGDKPEILLNKETDRREVENVLASMEISYGHENMAKTLALAASLAGGGNTAIHIYSDDVKKEVVQEAFSEIYVEAHNFGKAAANFSLISFGVAPEGDRVAAVAVIENQSDKAEVIEFAIRSGEEVLIMQTVNIDGREQQIVQIPDLPQRPFYEAVIVDDDAYLADNHFAAIYHDPAPKVYVAGDINPFAEKGFQTIGAELLHTTEKQLAAMNMQGIMSAEGEDLTDLPKQPAVFFHISEEKVPLTESLSGKQEGLLRYVEINQLYIKQASKPLPGTWDTVLKSGDIPLIQTGLHGGHPIIIVNFSLADSDWPLHAGFPIFLYNAYEQLAMQTDFLGYFSPGEEKWLNMSESATTLDIFTMDDKNLTTIDLKNNMFTAPAEPGTYQAVSQSQMYYFSVLLDDREKQAGSGDSFIWNEEQLAEETGGSADFSFWFWLALSALVLMLAEWEVFRRGHRV